MITAYFIQRLSDDKFLTDIKTDLTAPDFFAYEWSEPPVLSKTLSSKLNKWWSPAGEHSVYPDPFYADDCPGVVFGARQDAIKSAEKLPTDEAYQIVRYIMRWRGDEGDDE